MRRTTGAILIEMRPERMRRSAWRGEARNASKPNRATSTRPPTIDIISIAQHARPKVSGKSALDCAQRTALSTVVVITRCSTYFSSSSPPDVDEGHRQQRDEHDGLDHRERADLPELDGHRVEEDDLDVEEDEEH